MRSVSIFFLSSVLTLFTLGCYVSRERGDKVDSGFDAADVIGETNDTDGTGGAGGIDMDEDARMDDAPCQPNCPVLQWVTIQGGTFQMGSAEGTDYDDERPQHEVTVQSFKISKTEVTVKQYGACVDAGVCSEPRADDPFCNWGVSSRGNHPINGVNWLQARAFAQWLGGRLPSEAEWEYAARSKGRDIVYPWGNEDPTCERAVIDIGEEGIGCPYETTMEVCSRPLGNTAQGLCDMAGNVWEWVEDDYHDSYIGALSDGRAWIDSWRRNLRVLRGGSWGSGPGHYRCAYRAPGYSDDRNSDFGFRIVLDLK